MPLFIPHVVVSSRSIGISNLLCAVRPPSNRREAMPAVDGCHSLVMNVVIREIIEES